MCWLELLAWKPELVTYPRGLRRFAFKSLQLSWQLSGLINTVASQRPRQSIKPRRRNPQSIHRLSASIFGTSFDKLLVNSAFGRHQMKAHNEFSCCLLPCTNRYFRLAISATFTRPCTSKESAAQSKFNSQFCEARAGLRNFHFVRGENLIRIWRTQAFIFSHRIQ